VTRVLRAQTGFAPVSYLAYYGMNRATEATCGKFLARVEEKMAAF
jgi:hypothetical protein